MLAEVTQAIADQIKNNIVGLQTCEAYPVVKKAIKLPAVLIEVEQIPAAFEAEGEQLQIEAQFAARVIVDRVNQTDTIQTHEMQVRDLSIEVMQQLIKGGRFGLNYVGNAEGITAAEDGLKPELDGYNTWVVEWRMMIEIGASVWDDSGVVPTEIFLGFDPETGPAHINDYIQVYP